MERFDVEFTPDADDDVLASYEWGKERWGQELADKWIRGLYDTVFSRFDRISAELFRSAQ